ncbi:MAG: serine acetyltransferase [Deltaproteobacteria bacterium]|nr:serine acetyltransferase [Deltaproteobacteria bacterium]
MSMHLTWRRPVARTLGADFTKGIAELIATVTHGFFFADDVTKVFQYEVAPALKMLLSCVGLAYHEEPVVLAGLDIEALATELQGLGPLLRADIDAALSNDPATADPVEVLFSYPGFKAITTHRVAHVLFQRGVPLLPRMISEYAHQMTGIDIHPGAQIGSHFFIDHGTGVVIGETAIIGSHVTLYQGVTLGAKRFKRDDQGQLIKGQARHPILGDRVTVYAGAAILGRISVGAGSVIGGNVWLTESVPANSRITQQQFVAGFFRDGDGI